MIGHPFFHASVRCNPMILRKIGSLLPSSRSLLSKLPTSDEILSNLPTKASLLSNLPTKASLLSNLPTKASLLSRLPSTDALLSRLPTKTALLSKVAGFSLRREGPLGKTGRVQTEARIDDDGLLILRMQGALDLNETTALSGHLALKDGLPEEAAASLSKIIGTDGSLQTSLRIDEEGIHTQASTQIPLTSKTNLHLGFEKKPTDETTEIKARLTRTLGETSHLGGEIAYTQGAMQLQLFSDTPFRFFGPPARTHSRLTLRQGNVLFGAIVEPLDEDGAPKGFHFDFKKLWSDLTRLLLANSPPYPPFFERTRRTSPRPSPSGG